MRCGAATRLERILAKLRRFPPRVNPHPLTSCASTNPSSVCCLGPCARASSLSPPRWLRGAGGQTYNPERVGSVLSPFDAVSSPPLEVQHAFFCRCPHGWVAVADVSAERGPGRSRPCGGAESVRPRRQFSANSVFGRQHHLRGDYIAAFDAWLTTKRLKFAPVVIGCGLPSETVSGLSEEGHAGGKFPRPVLSERLDRVLTVVEPDLVFACYGINCGIYEPLDEARFASTARDSPRCGTALSRRGRGSWPSPRRSTTTCGRPKNSRTTACSTNTPTG